MGAVQAGEDGGRAQGRGRRPWAPLAGLGLALALLWIAYAQRGRALAEWRASAAAAVQVAQQERARGELLAREQAEGSRERAALAAELEHARSEHGRGSEELAAARGSAYRARLRAADLALDQGRLAEVSEWLGAEPPAQAGLEWHLLERARRESLRPLLQRDEPITALALSPTGGRWALGDLLGGVTLGSAAGERELLAGAEPRESVRQVAFDPSGETLVVASADWSARVLDVGSGNELADLAGHYGPVNAALFVGGRERIATGGEDGTLRLWDLAEPNAERWLVEAHGGPILALAADPRGERIASAALDLEVRLWSAHDGALLHTFEGHRDWIAALAFSGDGRRLASASDDGTAQVRDAHSGELLALLEGQHVPLIAVWLDGPGEVALTAGEDGSVRRYGVRGARERSRLEFGRWGLRTVAFAADGEGLLLSRGEGDLLWADFRRPPAWEELARADNVRALALDGAGHLAVGDGSGGVALLATAGGGPRGEARLGEAPIQALAFGGGARDEGALPLLAVGSADGTLVLLEGPELALARRFAGHAEGVAALALAADGKRLASASHSGELCLWDARSGARLAQKPGPRQLVLAVALEPELAQGAWIAGAGLVRAWFLEDGERSAALRVPELGRVRAAALSRGGAHLVTIDANEVLTRIDLAGAAPPARSEPHAARLFALALSPDGRRAATSALDGGLDIWDTERALHLASVPAPAGVLGSLTFGPGGDELVGALPDGRILRFGAARP